MTSARECFLVDTDGLSDDQRGDMCRAVLKAVASDADFYQCDIPFSPDWPVAVVRAAAYLRDADGKHPHDGSYILTRAFPNDDPIRWNAFVALAPWSYTAGAWKQGEQQERVGVSDEAQSIALWLTEEECQLVAAIVGPDRLLTQDENRRRRRAKRRP